MAISSLVLISGYLFLAKSASNSCNCCEVKCVLWRLCLFFLPSLSRLSLRLSLTSLLWLGASPGSEISFIVNNFTYYITFVFAQHQIWWSFIFCIIPMSPVPLSVSWWHWWRGWHWCQLCQTWQWWHTPWYWYGREHVMCTITSYNRHRNPQLYHKNSDEEHFSSCNVTGLIYWFAAMLH